MELLFFFILLIILVLQLRSQTVHHAALMQLRDELRNLAGKISKEEYAKPVETPPPTPQDLPAFTPAPHTKPAADFETAAPEEAIRSQPYYSAAPSVEAAEVNAREPIFQSAAAAPKPGFFERWLRDNPDLEKFIGENLINKIGIAVLVLGIGFFVKYAISKDWINEYGRAAIGILCGTLLIVVAHYLRSRFRSFSSVLAGGGIAVFYFTITFAFHEYRIVGQPAAFAMMIVITAFAVILSLLYNRLELAVISVTGGFLTPFLLSTGQGNYIVLFTYLAILNTGMLTLSVFKRWPLVTILSLLFTAFIFGGWLLQTFYFKPAPPPVTNAFIFASIFYVLFLGMAMLRNLLQKGTFSKIDFTVILLINVFYYSAGMAILDKYTGGNVKGIFTVVLGCANLLMSFLFYRQKRAQKVLLYLLIGLTLTYLTLTAPVQLEGRSITLFWAAESVLLLWLFQKSAIRLFRLGSVITVVLMIFSMLLDWEHVTYISDRYFKILFTGPGGMITNVVVAASFAGLAKLQAARAGDLYVFGISNRYFSRFFFLSALILVFVTAWAGINLSFLGSADNYEAAAWHRLLLHLAIAVFAWPPVHGRRKDLFSRAFVLLTAIGWLYHTASLPSIIGIRAGTLSGQVPLSALYVHWLGAIAAAGNLALCVRILYTSKNIFSNYKIAATWLLSIMSVALLTTELKGIYIFRLRGFADRAVLESQFERAGITILWAACASIMITIGLKKNYKPLRVISLLLFALALLKLFISDLRDIGAGGKIAAFVLLGILLLVISFMYQRLKNILIDDSPVSKN